MKRPGPPIQSVEDRRKLCLWLLDKARSNLPPEDRALAQDLYRVEAKINESRPTDVYSDEELIQFTIESPNGEWLYQGTFSMPLYAGKPSFSDQRRVMVPSCNSAIYLGICLEGRLPPIS